MKTLQTVILIAMAAMMLLVLMAGCQEESPAERDDKKREAIQRFLKQYPEHKKRLSPGCEEETEEPIIVGQPKGEDMDCIAVDIPMNDPNVLWEWATDSNGQPYIIITKINSEVKDDKANSEVSQSN